MTALVVIADADSQRGQRIADACRARGLTCAVTLHGAAALEAALEATPSVLVAQLALPLIDGPQLAGILRANPRTQNVGVLYLGDRKSDADGEQQMAKMALRSGRVGLRKFASQIDAGTA